jgi:hypothetical protein
MDHFKIGENTAENHIWRKYSKPFRRAHPKMQMEALKVQLL